jgi:ectoine hydroxylase-related dioxygenase (phytanoyl-CoA dioxygenase family)
MDEIERFRGIYDRMFAGEYKLNDEDFFDLATEAKAKDKKKLLPQIMNPGSYEPALRDSTYIRRATAVAKQMLGPKATFQFDHFIDKPLMVGKPTPWHQDQGYWDKKYWGKEFAVNFWLSLDEAKVENGCMQFIPGSNQGPILDHQHIGGNKNVHGMELPGLDASKAVACPLHPGGITIHWHNTLHYAGPNTTNNHRRAYISVFGYRDE